MQRKIWNGSFDRHPAVIVRCAGVSDVIAAVKLGRASGLPVSVRSGGHSFPGLSVADDALMIDLSPMKACASIPSSARHACRPEFYSASSTGRAGVAQAVPSGIVTHTGVAGLTLGGGIGWIMRKHGLSVDQLVSVDLVTAEGVRQSERGRERRPFLGRARRRHFGIVTEFEFRCVPLGTQVLAGRRLADGAVRGCPALLPRLGRGGARRADDDRPPPQGTAAALRSRGTAREAGRDGRPAGPAIWKRERSSSVR